jgi:hypothetical protein
MQKHVDPVKLQRLYDEVLNPTDSLGFRLEAYADDCVLNGTTQVELYALFGTACNFFLDDETRRSQTNDQVGRLAEMLMRTSGQFGIVQGKRNFFDTVLTNDMIL